MKQLNFWSGLFILKQGLIKKILSCTRRSQGASLARKLFIFTLLFFFSLNSFSQAKSVGGIIKDDNGEPLPGVSVVVKGTTMGTITNNEGHYSFTNLPADAVLQFSFVGMKTEEVEVGNQTSVDLIMKPSLVDIDEVVAIGYGTTTKKEVTGAVTSIKSDKFIQGDVSSPIGAIQGLVPGLSIISTNGSDPTSDYTIRLRGLSSLSGGKSPLIIVDGVVWEGSINSINPDQIQSIDVLKDGSAAAIYGTRATNGVILITLKSPEEGAVKFEISSYASLQAVEKDKAWLTPSEYRDAINKYAPAQASNLNKGSSTYWLDETTRTPINQNHNIAITGGSENISFRSNLSYKDNQGLFPENYSNVLSPSIFVNQKALKGRLNLDYKLFYSKTKTSNVPGDLYYQISVRNPTEPIYDPLNTNDNGYYNNRIQNSKNPVAMLNESTYDQEVNFLNAYVNANFELFDRFFIKFNLSNNSWQGISGDYLTRYYPLLGKTGQADIGSWNTNVLTFEPSLNYSLTLSNEHHFNLLSGYSYTEGNNRNLGANNANFDTDKFSYNNIEAGNDLITGLAGMNSYRESNKLIAFYGRVNYNFADKYLASASLRYEGSSRFGTNNKWGMFPALSLGWRINEEDFLNDLRWINELKIRAGIGVTGNQNIPNYLSIPRLSTRKGDSSGLFYYDQNWMNVYVPYNNPNPDLKWERKTEIDFGVDFAFFDRFSGTVDFYKRTISDLLWWYNVPVPPNVYDNVYANVGEMTNTGFEANIEADVVRKGGFWWNSTIIYSKNVNKLTKLADPSRGYELDFVKITPAATSWAQLLREGESVGNFWAPIYTGVDESGSATYEDIDGNGVDKNSIGDRRIVGNEYPDFEVGWQNNLKYKQFFMSFSFRAVIGQSLLNWSRLSFENMRPLLNGNNVLRSTLDNPEFMGDIVYDSRFVDKASYAKLDNLVFGYDFNFDEFNFRLYISGSNLLTITKFEGNDPEQPIPGFNTDTEKFGGDNLTYPYSRIFLLGLKLNF